MIVAALTGSLLYNPQFPWYADLFFGLLLGVMCMQVLRFHNRYSEAFARLICTERADFTNPKYATGRVRTFVPRLCFYLRKDCWQGPPGQNSPNNKKAYVAVECGEDTVVWFDDPDYDGPEKVDTDDLDPKDDVWCKVIPGMRISELRTTADYFDMAANKRGATGDPFRARRAWGRELQRNGFEYNKAEHGGEKWLDDKLLWLYCAGCLLAGVLIVMFVAG